jgi:hypothetical protein
MAINPPFMQQWAAPRIDGVCHVPPQGDMRDGMLAHYLEQAADADSNIERRIDEEPFDFRDMTCTAKEQKDHE